MSVRYTRGSELHEFHLETGRRPAAGDRMERADAKRAHLEQPEGGARASAGGDPSAHGRSPESMRPPRRARCGCLSAAKPASPPRRAHHSRAPAATISAARGSALLLCTIAAAAVGRARGRRAPGRPGPGPGPRARRRGGQSRPTAATARAAAAGARSVPGFIHREQRGRPAAARVSPAPGAPPLRHGRREWSGGHRRAGLRAASAILQSEELAGGRLRGGRRAAERSRGRGQAGGAGRGQSYRVGA